MAWATSIGNTVFAVTTSNNVIAIEVTKLKDPNLVPIYKKDYIGLFMPYDKPFRLGIYNNTEVAVTSIPGTVPAKYYYCTFPVWLLLVVSLVYPATFIIYTRSRKNYRKKKGVCLKCGYNLFGNVTNICPECGTPFDPKLLEPNMNNNPPKEKESS
ncbi:MAG: hypothetical protein ACYTA5_18315 [Planctomycetota bacterium]